MVNGPLPQGSGDLMNRRHTGTLRSAFGLVASLAIVASAFSASASALTPAMGLEAPRVATLAAAKHRRPTQKSSSVQKKSAKSAPPKAVRRPPKGPKVATPPPPPPRPPKHRPPQRPWVPPAAIVPELTLEQTKFLASLPRRADRAPQGRTLPQRVERQILALLDQNQPQSLDAELARVYGLDLLRSRPIELLAARAVLFRVRAGRSEANALVALQRDTRVRSAQFNLLYYHTAGKPREVSPIPHYGPRNVRLPDAHKLALGRNVLIAVIDFAVDTEHPDLKGAVVRSFDATGGRDVAPNDHGTAIAGIIRARGIVEGAAPQAEIMAVSVMRSKRGSLPEADTEGLLAGINWAIRNGAKVLNMSFESYDRDPALQDLLRKAQQERIVLVAAAGNKGRKPPPVFPAAYPGVIAVTAVDEADRRWQGANRGPFITVAAPGVDILAPIERGGYAFLSGTSFATAYVSGIAALLLERDPTMDPAAIAKLIADGADDLGPAGRDDDFGAGRVNALASLKLIREVAAR